jgi:predicted phosphate transport protein (TIGR00153 family)
LDEFEVETVVSTIDPYDASSEQKAIDIAQDHCRKIVSAVKELSLLYDDWVEGDYKEAEERLDRISRIEKEANKLKHELLDELSKATTMVNREDLMRLALVIDEIADVAEGTGFRITAIHDWRPNADFKKEMQGLIEKLITATEKLRLSIFMLSQNPTKSLEFADEVDAIEQEADRIQRRVGHSLYTSKLEPRTLIMLKELVAHFEEMADTAERAADAIRIVAMSRSR